MNGAMKAISPVLGVFLAFIATAPLFLPDFYVTLLNYIGMATLVTPQDLNQSASSCRS